MYGIIKVGAIDCEHDEELCEEFAVYSVPTILVFQENYGDEGEPYKGKMTWKSISTFATSKMQNFVSSVNKDNYESFMERDPSKFKVLFFTERKSTAPLFKALSKTYKDKLLFGEVRKSESELVSAYKIEHFPDLLVVTDPFEYKADYYNEAFEFDQLNKFLNKYAYTQAKYEKKVEVSHLTSRKLKT